MGPAASLAEPPHGSDAHHTAKCNENVRTHEPMKCLEAHARQMLAVSSRHELVMRAALVTSVSHFAGDLAQASSQILRSGGHGTIVPITDDFGQHVAVKYILPQHKKAQRREVTAVSDAPSWPHQGRGSV